MTPGSAASAASNRLLWTILEFHDAHSCACSCLDSYQYQLHWASQISYRAWVEERWSRSVQEYLQSWVPDRSIEITRDRHKDSKISEVKLSEHTEDWAATISAVHLQYDRWEALKPYSQNFPPKANLENIFKKQISDWVGQSSAYFSSPFWSMHSQQVLITWAAFWTTCRSINSRNLTIVLEAISSHKQSLYNIHFPDNFVWDACRPQFGQHNLRFFSS